MRICVIERIFECRRSSIIWPTWLIRTFAGGGKERTLNSRAASLNPWLKELNPTNTSSELPSTTTETMVPESSNAVFHSEGPGFDFRHYLEIFSGGGGFRTGLTQVTYSSSVARCQQDVATIGQHRHCGAEALMSKKVQQIDMSSNINGRRENVSATFVLAKNQNLLYSRPIRKYVAEVYAKRGEADSCRFLELEWRLASKAARR
uniref:Uncharacterized protein n=1 Tax=Vespula pensylvanica TaxID=30213 RepID=A0A834PF99_VESPE|nr:hypothetical protein H0235_000985 [Vespula pensylvanica]